MQVARALLLASLVLACTSAPARSPGLDRIGAEGLTPAQARQVLQLVLRHERFHMHLPGTFIDADQQDEQGQPPHPGYLDFSVGRNAPDAAATEFWGLFAVSRATGDVWELNLCRRYRFAELTRMQRRIMARTGQTLADEAALRRGLGCPDS